MTMRDRDHFTYTPIHAPRGTVVHAISFTGNAKTACGKPVLRWKIALKKVSCRECQALLGPFPVRKSAKSKRAK